LDSDFDDGDMCECGNEISHVGEECFPESPICHGYYREGYKLRQGGDDSDIFVLESPFFTFAQFCSPCAPGACYLLNWLEGDENCETNRAYCLGHDWFEDSKAPYPVYSVATGTLVKP
jgi:hypothetical protein